jgi:hypothetical protein
VSIKAKTPRRPPRPEPADDLPFEVVVDEAAPVGNVLTPLAALLLGMVRKEEEKKPAASRH